VRGTHTHFTPPRGLGGNPERKNTPCIFDLARVKFFLKKERVFFFRGSALQVFGQAECKCNSDEAKQNYFCGRKGFALPRLILFETVGFVPRRRVRKECAGVSVLIFGGNMLYCDQYGTLAKF